MKFLPFRSKTIVLLYHRIASEISDPWSLCVTPEHFVEHLEVLQRFRRTPLSRIEPCRYPIYGGPDVVITFDDGYSDNARVAAPLLLQYDTPATFFIASGYLDGAFEYWWDELERIIFESDQLPSLFTAVVERQPFSWQIPQDQPRAAIYSFLYEELRPLGDKTRRALLDQLTDVCRPVLQARATRRSMTVEDLRRMAAEPLFEIGAHTVMHPLLAARPMSEQYGEIRGSKAFLEEHLDREIPSFSYPYGGKQHYLPATVEAVRECGFSRACTTAGYPVSRRDGPFEISRLNITDMDGEAFLKLLLLS